MNNDMLGDENFKTLNILKDNSNFLSKNYLNPLSYQNIGDYVNASTIFSSFLMMMLEENGITKADINERFNEINIYFNELKQAGLI